MSEYARQMPVVALRNIVVLPGMLIHFDVNRDFSVAAVDEAMHKNQEIFLTLQKFSDIENPDIDDLNETGCVSIVKQVVKLPGNIYRVMVGGVRRGKLLKLTQKEPFYAGAVNIKVDPPAEFEEDEEEAMVRNLRELLDEYFNYNNKFNKDIIKQIISNNGIEKLIEQASIQIPMSIAEKQKILDAGNIFETYNVLTQIISNEIQVIKIKKELQDKLKDRVDRNQKEYILKEQLKVIHEELDDDDTLSDADGYLEKVDGLEASEEVKNKIRKEIKHFKTVSASSSEAAVSRTYIETLLELPWDKKSEDNNDVANAEKILNADHYGLTKVKERILEFLAVRSITKGADAPIICLVGPPGTGKTSIARSVAKALDREYVRISLGGVRDEAEIRGHRRTYVGAMPGRFAVALKNSGVKNPLMLLDEIDKMASDYKGDPSAALLELLDGEQNSKFSDHYVEIPLDMSEVLFIATANSLQGISKPLLDRMEIIEVNSYTANEKLHIAKEHLVKKQLVKNGLTKKQLSVTGKALEKLISAYTREAGVRGLERKIGELCRKAVKELIDINGPEHALEGKIKITDKELVKYLGKEKFKDDRINKKPLAGIVRGLAWTSAGGDTLEIEVNVMPGKGAIELTGKMGDVMKESARIAVSYVRSVASDYKVDDEYFAKHDIHIHIPEGAVPKDGPSAGITMATAVLSAVTSKPVSNTLAMTGEVTLRGRVLAIGGLKEKLLAAKMAGVKKVLVPESNISDVDELESEITDGLEIIFVDSMKEVVKEAFI